ncbi:MAG: hypothetical protein GF330_04010 [Candidatus Eisenbacteria bacterium]|nr:hypothetical protein [Candidatus Eisenbacteria bacterium]
MSSTAPPRRRPRRLGWRWWAGLLLAGLLLLATLWLLRGRVSTEFAGPERDGYGAATTPLCARRLYYGREAGTGLLCETRYLPCSGILGEDARVLIEALGEPSAVGGVAVWPAETVVQDLFLSDAGVLYVNFGSSLRWRAPRGDWAEWLIAATLTRTLCENLSGVAGVRILIDGESTGTLVRTIPLDEVLRPAAFSADG